MPALAPLRHHDVIRLSPLTRSKRSCRGHRRRTGFDPQPTKAPSKSRSAVGLPQCYLPLRSTGEIVVKRREFITLLGSAVSVFLCVSAAAQEGYYGIGHDKWHRDFYSKLKRNDGRGSCCNLMDCRPTQSRMVGDHYEVKVDGAWTPVPYDKINNVVAPDGGAHVCAPSQVGPNKGVLFCVILPSEG